MKLDWLKPLLGRPGPFTTVYIDATRADAAGETEVLDRWKGLRRDVPDVLAEPMPQGEVVFDTLRISRSVCEPLFEFSFELARSRRAVKVLLVPDRPEAADDPTSRTRTRA